MTPAGGERLRRVDRIRDRRDFQRVSREGARVSSRSFVILAAPRRCASRDACSRLGITTSRRVGSSVVRARVRRHVREWFRRKRKQLPRGRDVVVIARPAAGTLSQQAIAGELGESAERLRAAVAARGRRP